ncbi:alpha-2-HS-glycoprotein 1 [Micropterus dolomieu]|uniref:alpha-2-HS-glycoprotein 1 n=1 Tax=Micropterus dolomieu TaxID=147949 RepID=UPI001E8E8BC1|nr:alpha-2-HS-glycoprotein 1 [Micropterus dolomieu]
MHDGIYGLADNGCNVELLLDLLETKCHVVNPQHFEDCELRRVDEREVMANCTVMMTVKNSDAKVTKYDCDTRQVKTNMEMMMICPDCPMLISLDSPEGIKSVNEGVKKFNQNTTNQRYYILQEVGRISSAYMMATGMSYFAEFALVETHCPMGSRIIPEACKPLCPDRAHHAVCSSSYSSTDGLQSVECEFYPPSNSTTLGPGEQGPGECRHRGRPSHAGGHGHHPHTHGHGHHPHTHGHGHRPNASSHEHHQHAGGHGHHRNTSSHGRHPDASSRGPPPHAGGRGPPPHDAGQRQDRKDGPPFNSYHRLKPFLSCHGFRTNFDPALHPICPWPHPETNPDPKLSQS